MKQKFNISRELISNYYLADYFIKTRNILKHEHPNQQVTMQWFQRTDNVILCGISEVLQVLSMITDNDKLIVYALNDGDLVNNMEPVLKITGPYYIFGWLEGLIDGILSRSTSVATSSFEITEAANKKIVLNMNDRSDHPLLQSIDGYASYVGGIRNFVSLAAIKYINDENVKKPQGTMPHALIQSYDGDLIKAAEAFCKYYPDNDLTVLVDFANDCVNDSLKAAKHFGEKLKYIRLDTSKTLIDKFLQEHANEYDKNKDLHGVCPELVFAVRQNLDNNGFEFVKIIVSSGFNAEKINYFENCKTPVDIYGIGEAITQKKITFTGDAVNIDGKDIAKVGRKNILSDRLSKIEL
ncbi:nicotinate phosphoribosyltransferase [Spiroplasma endosymbiont of Labia minor]|uniref:nicotinate phosphoribosyltransferase n=1 Tax=Spiroplasma endosymbiont of Labia minor TaxID=3066305 RepID=UPI0030D403CD